jgi:hypothetical protein
MCISSSVKCILHTLSVYLFLNKVTIKGEKIRRDMIVPRVKKGKVFLLQSSWDDIRSFFFVMKVKIDVKFNGFFFFWVWRGWVVSYCGSKLVIASRNLTCMKLLGSKYCFGNNISLSNEIIWT